MILATVGSVFTGIAAVGVPLILKFGLLSIALGWLSVKTGPLFDKTIVWINAHVKNKALAHVLVWGDHLAENVVLRLEVDLRPVLKSFEDSGKLTPDAAKQIKTTAIRDFKDLAGPEALDFVHSVLGFDSASLDAWISGLIEKAVGNLSTAQTNAAVASAKVAESSGTAQVAHMLQGVASHALASGLLGEPPSEKADLASVTPITAAPSVQPAPEPKGEVPTDAQDAAKAPIEPSPK